MPATLIPTSRGSSLYTETERRFWSSWSNPTLTKPSIVGVFYVNHEGHQVWKNYESYKKKVGNVHYMWHGAKRTCTIGDDGGQIYACHNYDCGVCHILRATLDPEKAAPKSMLGLGAYVAPNSSKSYTYLKPKDKHEWDRMQRNSPNLVMIRCAVVVGRTYVAKGPMKHITESPSGYDSISARKGYTSNGKKPVSNDETVVFTKSAILPVELVVLRDPGNTSYPANEPTFNRRLINVRDTGSWDTFPEAIRNTYKGDILWTDGNGSYTFPSRPRIRWYKVVRRSPANDPNGVVVDSGYASADPFYFQLA